MRAVGTEIVACAPETLNSLLNPKIDVIVETGLQLISIVASRVLLQQQQLRLIHTHPTYLPPPPPPIHHHHHQSTNGRNHSHKYSAWCKSPTLIPVGKQQVRTTGHYAQVASSRRVPGRQGCGFPRWQGPRGDAMECQEARIQRGIRDSVHWIPRHRIPALPQHVSKAMVHAAPPRGGRRIGMVENENDRHAEDRCVAPIWGSQ